MCSILSSSFPEAMLHLPLRAFPPDSGGPSLQGSRLGPTNLGLQICVASSTVPLTFSGASLVSSVNREGRPPPHRIVGTNGEEGTGRQDTDRRERTV